MEWLVLVAVLVCPIAMIAMGVFAWYAAKRADRRSDDPAVPLSDQPSAR